MMKLYDRLIAQKKAAVVSQVSAVDCYLFIYALLYVWRETGTPCNAPARTALVGLCMAAMEREINKDHCGFGMTLSYRA